MPTKCILYPIYHDRWGQELVKDLGGGQVAGAAVPLEKFSIQDMCRLALLFSF